MKTFPLVETTFLLPGALGDIEVLVTPAPAENDRQATAIICHPHPLFGGTMKNKVVSTLARTFRELGLRTVRFNFRGVGRTAGKYDEGIGETEDLLKVIEWVKTVYPKDPLWLSGFSFGAYVSARAAVQVVPSQLVSIAPQVSRFIDAKLPPILCPWVLVQGDEDTVVSPQELKEWIPTLSHPPEMIWIHGAGHFFHGKLVELRERLKSYMNPRIRI